MPMRPLVELMLLVVLMHGGVAICCSFWVSRWQWLLTTVATEEDQVPLACHVEGGQEGSNGQ